MGSSKRFTKTKEDFVCERCGHEVFGNGYTNHCPRCLWSKHVDINPGDRNATCNGMMKPVAVEKKGEQYRIIHTCTVCGHQKKNKTAPNDAFEVLVTLSSLNGEKQRPD